MLAVVPGPARVAAAAQRVLGARAAHVVQQDGPRARAEAAAPRGSERAATAQQAAHDAGIPDVPVVVAHRAPHALVADLNPALAAAAPVSQAQGRVCGRTESESGDSGDRRDRRPPLPRISGSCVICHGRNDTAVRATLPGGAALSLCLSLLPFLPLHPCRGTPSLIKIQTCINRSPQRTSDIVSLVAQIPKNLILKQKH